MSSLLFEVQPTDPLTYAPHILADFDSSSALRYGLANLRRPLSLRKCMQTRRG